MPVKAEIQTQKFEQFYQENLGPIYRYVYSHVRNQQEVEDLTAHIFLKAVRGYDPERTEGNGRTWLFQVARTTIADYWRLHYRTALVSLDDLLESGWEGPGNEDVLETSNQAAERVDAILQGLSARYREVLTCRFLLNLSTRETAARMGITEINVRVMQTRALKRAADLEELLY